MARGPKVLLIVSIVVNVVGWGAFVVGFVFLGAQFVDLFQTGLDPERELDLVIDVPGDGEVDLEPDRYQVVALGPDLTYTTGFTSDAGGQQVHRDDFAEPEVVVTGPGGEELPLEPPSIDRLTSTPGQDAVGIWEFTAETEGTYTLEASPTSESREVTQVGVGEARGLWEEASGWILPTFVITGGALLGSLGIVLLVFAVIWIVVSGVSRSNQAPRPPGPAPGGPPPPGPVRVF